MSKRGVSPISAAEAAKRFASSLENGGASRDRTGDLKLAKLALSQLSYGPAVMGSHQSSTLMGSLVGAGSSGG